MYNICYNYIFVCVFLHLVSFVIIIFNTSQVIVEKVPKSSIPDIDKKKFLVPADLSGEKRLCHK